MLNLVQNHDGRIFQTLSKSITNATIQGKYLKLSEIKRKKIKVTMTTRVIYAGNIDHNKEQFQNLM